MPSVADLVVAKVKLAALAEKIPSARPLSWYVPGRKLVVSDRMADAAGMPRRYTYRLEAPPGRDFDPEFRPRYTPGQMLKLGVFSGRYVNDCTGEFPREWFEGALAAGKLRPDGADPAVNLFRVASRKSSNYWIEKGWIPLAAAASADRDPRGWFQWYCRYWLGRRVPDLDAAQIKRWKSFRRHAGQIAASYKKMRPADVPKTPAEKRGHRAKQRQGLLQWSHDPWV